MDNRVLLLEERLKNTHEKLDELMESQQKMLLELTKYRGLWGGVMLVITALAACLEIGRDWIFAHVKS